MRPRIRAAGLVLALASVLALALAGGGYSHTTASTIKLGGIFDLSGPTADVGVPYADGEKAYVSYVNSKGGIKGSKIEFIAQDTGYNLARSQAFYEQLRTSGIAAILGWATADTEAFKARVAADHLPFMSASYAEQVANPADTPYNFFIAPSYSQQMRIALRYIAKKNPNRQVKVAVFYNDSPFGQSPLQGGKDYISAKRLKIDYKTYAMPRGATDYTAQLTQAGSVDYIIVQNTSAPAATLAKDIARLGNKAKLILLNWSADELFVGLAGKAAAGAIGVQPFGTTGLKVPGLRAPARWLASHGGQSLAKKGIHYVQGWYTMATMVQVIKRLRAQGKDVNGVNIKAALEAMPAFTTGGVTGKIKFSGRSHAGQRSSRVFQVLRGRFRQISTFVTP
jgi:branched-chain amino acid transport system substrate-binding protein